MNVYQEENSTFSSNGINYDLNYIWKAVSKDPILFIDIRKLVWVLEYVEEIDEERVSRADYTTPLLVAKDTAKDLVIDGLHRLIKAVRDKVKTLPYRYVSEQVLKLATIKNSPMKLYHYSKKRYDVLKSRRVQGVCTKEEIEEAEKFALQYSSGGPYIDSLSLFFDPIPYILLPKIFKNGHHTWVKGNELFEYVINVDSLEKNINYYVTETPDDLKDLDKIDDNKWENDPNYSVEYFKHKFKRKQSTGEIGTSLSKLKDQIKIYAGGTEQSYIAASKRSDFIDNQNKYAASVPHVMVYPSNGIINIESTRKIKMGYTNNSLPLPVLESLKQPIAKPIFTNW